MSLLPDVSLGKNWVGFAFREPHPPDERESHLQILCQKSGKSWECDNRIINRD
jgi:hypothetical protein